MPKAATSTPIPPSQKAPSVAEKVIDTTVGIAEKLAAGIGGLFQTACLDPEEVSVHPSDEPPKEKERQKHVTTKFILYERKKIEKFPPG